MWRSGSIFSRPRSRILASLSFCDAASLGLARRRIALTRSTSRRCENGLRMKSSAPILSPNSSSISSSFEVRKITGRSDFWRSRRKQLHAVHARHLDVEDGEIGRVGLQAVERARAVGVGLNAVAFRLQRKRNGSQDVAVVVDQGDRRHESPVSIPTAPRGIGRGDASYAPRGHNRAFRGRSVASLSRLAERARAARDRNSAPIITQNSPVWPMFNGRARRAPLGARAGSRLDPAPGRAFFPAPAAAALGRARLERGSNPMALARAGERARERGGAGQAAHQDFAHRRAGDARARLGRAADDLGRLRQRSSTARRCSCCPNSPSTPRISPPTRAPRCC